MKKVGFLTSQDDPQLTTDDLLTRAAFHKEGWEIVPILWEEGMIDEQIDALIFRSCWNSHRNPRLFLSRLDKLRAFEKPIFNSISSAKWNFHKSYLFELRERGADIPQTALLKESEEFSEGIHSTIKAPRLVLKPAISANGENTFLLEHDDFEEIARKIASIRHLGDILIQEFVPEIMTSGETSFIFFNGEFSHALRKIPRGDEFRVQVEYGGRRERVSPDVALIQQAKAILNLVPERLLFARVDAVASQRKLVLIELEILDPMLYFGIAPETVGTFASAFAAGYAAAAR